MYNNMAGNWKKAGSKKMLKTHKNKTMKGGSGIIEAAKTLLLPALFYLGQKTQQKRVITQRKNMKKMKKYNKTMRK